MKKTMTEFTISLDLGSPEVEDPPIGDDNFTFSGVKLHYLHVFPVLINRTETLADTLKKEHRTILGASRLYKADCQILSNIVARLNLNRNFSSTQIIHSSSDLGISHQVSTNHSSGAKIFFDGLIIRASFVISTDSFDPNQILEKTGYPQTNCPAVYEFMQNVCEILPQAQPLGSWFQIYYTFDVVRWEKLQISRKGEPQVLLQIHDPNMFTLTSGSIGQGLNYSIYLGREKWIHQMISHDLFITSEIDRYLIFFKEKLDKILQIQNNLKSHFSILTSNFFRILSKHKAWAEVKTDIITLYDIDDITERGILFVGNIKKFIKNRIAFRNADIEIWIKGEEPDPEEKRQELYEQFFILSWDGTTIRADEKSLKKTPFYDSRLSDLEERINKIRELITLNYRRETDISDLFQTEFSLYAVIFSIIAIIIAIIAIVFSNQITIPPTIFGLSNLNNSNILP